MRLGLGVPMRAGADLRSVAKAAERDGFTSLWVCERLLVRHNPTQGWYDLPGMPWPDMAKDTLDPLVAMTVLAEATETVRFGSSVIAAPVHLPVQLAKAFASIERLSGGRLIAGLGAGWSEDEFAAAGTTKSRRGRDLDEALDVLEAVWGPDPVAYKGERTVIEPSFFGPKPKARIPVMLGSGVSKAALDRVARRADGWLPAMLPPAVLAQAWDQIRDKATEYGRDATKLELIPRANVMFTERPVADSERYTFMGSKEQVFADMAATIEAGADELIVDLTLQDAYQGEQWLVETAQEVMERLAAAKV